MRWLLAMIVLTGCATRDACPVGDLVTPRGASPAFAVVRADATYSSAAIALLGATGEILAPDFVDSGTRVTTLVTSLSGDALLPSTPLGTGVVSWLDRGNDLVVIADGTGTATAIDVRTAQGVPADPYDAIRLADGRLLVARYRWNANADTELERGNDVAIVSEHGVTARIDLHADEVLGADVCTGPACVAYARPAVLLPFGDGVLVVLDRLTQDYHHGASGALVVVDPATLTASAPVVLPGLQNCYHASPEPDGPGAWILCSGVIADPSRAAHAGLAHVTPDGAGAITVTDLLVAPGGLAPGNGIIALDAERALYVVSGDLLAHAPDQLVSFAAGEATVIYTSDRRAGDTAFVLGEGVAIDGGATGLVPDANTGAILRFDVSTAHATLTDEIAFDDCVGLPPRMIRPVAF